MSAKADASISVSVLIANYNGEHLLDDCLQSILNQSVASELEIIVHDDASTDASLTVLSQRYPQLRLLSSDRNVGFCVANNRMAAAASGRYLLLLNNDAALQPDSVEALLKAADRSAPNPIVATVPQYDWESGELVDRGCHLDPFYNPIPNQDPQSPDVAMVIGACLFIDRALWNQIGGFPEWFGSIAEDMYLCCAARLRGAKVVASQNSGYRHRQGASFGGSRVSDGKLVSNVHRRRLSERNKTMVMLVCTPGLALLALLPLHLFLLLTEGLVMTVAAKSLQPLRLIYLNAIASVWTFRHQWITERKRAAETTVLGTMGYFQTFRPWPRKLQMLIKHGLPKLKLSGQRSQR